MAERARAPLPDEIDGLGIVILPPVCDRAGRPIETPLARRQRERRACGRGHAWLPETTIVCFTEDNRRVRRCLVCQGRYRGPLPPAAQEVG